VASLVDQGGWAGGVTAVVTVLTGRQAAPLRFTLPVKGLAARGGWALPKGDLRPHRGV
jgi:hypothetical protein